MSDRIFYVGAQPQSDEKGITGYVAAKFLTLNGKPVVDPTPGNSQRVYIYADGSDRYKTPGKVANPNNYLIVPANYTERQARAFADEIANTMRQAYPGDETGTTGLSQALGRMAASFFGERFARPATTPAVGNSRKFLCSGFCQQRVVPSWIGDLLG